MTMQQNDIGVIAVAYDISMFRLVQIYGESARSGIFRVAENVARGLVGSAECEVSFFAGLDNYASSCREFVRSSPDFALVPFIGSKSQSVRRFVEGHRNRRLRPWREVASIDQPGRMLRDLAPVRRTWRKLLVTGGERLANLVEKHIDLPDLLRRDILHSPFHGFPEVLRQSQGIEKFLTVHDLGPIVHPEYFDVARQVAVKSALGSVCRDDWVICISEFTKQELCEHTDTISPSHAFVTHLAADPQVFYPVEDKEIVARIRAKYGIPDGPYLLCLNTLDYRKNMEGAIRAFAEVTRAQRVDDLSLVLVGARGWLHNQILSEIASVGSLMDRIIVTGYVPDEDLAPLYSGSIAFVYPSFYEGFGLPVLEAMQCGVPVIASRTTSLPEIVGAAGLLVDPADTDELSQCLWTIYSEPGLRNEMALRSLDRAKGFSWSRCVDETIAAYRTALSA
jgi:glycosyltransferase involved in cell wall biosynthesis